MREKGEILDCGLSTAARACLAAIGHGYGLPIPKVRSANRTTHALRVPVGCLTEHLNSISLYCYSHY